MSAVQSGLLFLQLFSMKILRVLLIGHCCLLSEPQFGYNVVIRVTLWKLWCTFAWNLIPVDQTLKLKLQNPPWNCSLMNCFHFKSKIQTISSQNYSLLSPVTSFCSLNWKVSAFMWLCFVIIKYNTNDSDTLRRDILGLPTSFIHNVTIRECCHCFFISVLHLLI